MKMVKRGEINVRERSDILMKIALIYNINQKWKLLIAESLIHPNQINSDISFRGVQKSFN